MNTKILMVIFILAATTLVLIGHIGLYFSWVDLFDITTLKTQIILAVVLGILSISFILTSLLVFWKDNIITDTIYTYASMWLGFVWYAAIATGLTWVMIIIISKFTQETPHAFIASIFLLSAILYSAYGVWNANNPIEKEITITIPGLPDEWKGKKIIQLSDIHLGPIRRENFLKKIVRTTNAHSPYAVFITGDLFDGGGINLHKLAEPLDKISATAGTYYITGNHETYVGIEKSLNALSGMNIVILRDEVIDVHGLQIVGVDYPEPSIKKYISVIIKKINKNQPSIILYHEPLFLDEFENAGGGLLLSGHTHKGQMWPFGGITNRIYKGYDYGLKKYRSLNVYTSSGVGTWGPPMRTGNHPEIVIITLQ